MYIGKQDTHTTFSGSGHSGYRNVVGEDTVEAHHVRIQPDEMIQNAVQFKALVVTVTNHWLS